MRFRKVLHVNSVFFRLSSFACLVSLGEVMYRIITSTGIASPGFFFYKSTISNYCFFRLYASQSLTTQGKPVRLSGGIMSVLTRSHVPVSCRKQQQLKNPCR